MKTDKNVNSIEVFRALFRILPQRFKSSFYFLLAGMVTKACLETGTMGVIAFFAASLSQPEAMMETKYVQFLQTTVGFDFLVTVQGFILSLSITVVTLVILKNAFKAYFSYLTAGYNARLEAFFGNILISGFLNMPYHWHLTENSADLVYSVEIRKYIGRNFIAATLRLCSDSLLVLIMITGLLIIQPAVSLLVLIILGGSSYLIYSNVRTFIDQNAEKCHSLEKSINKEATKSIHGIKDVIIFGREKSFSEQTEKKLSKFCNYFGWYKFLELSPVVILETIGFILITASVCLMLFVLNTSAGTITGTIALLAVAAWKCLPAIQRILQSITVSRYSLPFVYNVLNYIDEINDNKTTAATDTPDPSVVGSRLFSSSLVFNNVCFKYPKSEQNVLDHINFTIEKGETIGIIGASGAGKSTLVDMMTALLKPSQGEITIDGRPLINAKEWRKMIGYVSQSPYIYDGTVAENVAFGLEKESIDTDQVAKCCSMASMDEFLCDLPEGIHNEIGERGVRLSGGQQQRVAIARALYHDPGVMIFDEATSSLDTKSEKEIIKTIYSLKKAKTLIIIAHRLTTVEDCDRIIWIDKGKIKKIGKPEEILSIYQDLDNAGTSPN